jgi:hypothetical protein
MIITALLRSDSMSHRLLSSLTTGAGALLVAVALTGCSAGPPQLLRGPARQKGEASRTEFRMTLKNGKIVLRGGGQSTEGTWSMTSTAVEDDEFLEVEGRQVTKLRTTVLTDDYSESMKIEGETQNKSEPGPLLGETILRQRLGGKWKNTLVGKDPTPKQQKELDALPERENDDDLLPEDPVKPGYTWKLDATRLRKHFGSSCTGLTGESKKTFVRTTTFGGEECLLIDIVMDVKGKMLDDDNNELDVELKAKGSAHQSLRTGYDVRTTMTGTMKMSGTVLENGQRVHIEMSGEVTIETSTKPK